MYCSQCGTENPDNAVFCKECGYQLINGNDVVTPAVEENHASEVFEVNSVASTLSRIFSSGLFLALTIISTVGIAVSYSSSFLLQLISSISDSDISLPFLSGSASVFSIIITVCLWIIYVNAKKGNIHGKSLKTVAVVEKVRFILNIVGASLSALCAVLFSIVLALGSAAFSSINMSDITSQIPDEVLEKVPEIGIALDRLTPAEIIAIILVVTIVVFIFITVACILNSIFSKIKNTQLNALIDGINNNKLDSKFPSSLKVFLILFAVFSILGFSLGSICMGTVNILLVVIINQVNTQLEPFIRQ